MLKNYVLTPKNIAENIYVEKTYHIRKVGRAPKKKKRVLVSFPRSATPLPQISKFADTKHLVIVPIFDKARLVYIIM